MKLHIPTPGRRCFNQLAAVALACFGNSPATAAPASPGSFVLGLGVDGATFGSDLWNVPVAAIVPRMTLGYQFGARLRAEMQATWWQRRFDDLTFYEDNEVAW